MRLKGKIAVVTGAAGGIGNEIATAYVREGACVAIADLDLKGAQATARALDKAGTRAMGVAMDVTQEDQVETDMAQVIKVYGGIDVLVSNAGIEIVAPLDQFEFAKWKKLLAIHLDGAFLTTRAALRQMYKQGRGGSSSTWGRSIPRRRRCSRRPTSPRSTALSASPRWWPRKAPSTACAPTSSVPASSARPSSISRSRSKPRSLAYLKPT